jgi:hypothetical protein
MGAAAWLRLLIRHRFAIDPPHRGIAAIATLLAIRNSAMGAVQSAIRLIRPGPPLPRDPIIILGHWRCGTTLLHELLAVDPRHTAPGTYECLAASHFRSTEPVAMRLLAGLLPEIHRPMDRMPIAWGSPQEDDLAMLALGCGSLYDRIAFPEADVIDPCPSDARWRRLLSRWLREVLSRRPGRLVLKSPLHMARIPALLNLFPEAVFVHIVRDPYVVFPSTLHMWEALQGEHGLAAPRPGRQAGFVFETFEWLHTRFDQDRDLIPRHRLIEIRYEDLIRHPRQTLANVYTHLRLGEFATAQPGVDAYLESVRGHETNRYPVSIELAEQIGARWGRIIARQGYALRETTRALRAC